MLSPIWSLYCEHLEAHRRAIEDLSSCICYDFHQAVEILAIRIISGNKILICGNGGSAADSEHLATEFAVRYCTDRKPIPALSLSSSGPLLTAAYNDGYSPFQRQVEAFGKPGDVLIAISTSGTSDNILKAINSAKTLGITVIGLTGKHGFRATQHTPILEGIDVELRIPSDSTSIVQEMHILVYHALVEALEKELDRCKESKCQI